MSWVCTVCQQANADSAITCATCTKTRQEGPALTVDKAIEALQHRAVRAEARARELESKVRACLEESAISERRDFVRQAAIAMRTAHWPSGPVLCWREASELWDAKPEDC